MGWDGECAYMCECMSLHVLEEEGGGGSVEGKYV